VEVLVVLGFEERDRLERDFGVGWRPLTEEELETWQERFEEGWGVETAEEGIDRGLYEEST